MGGIVHESCLKEQACLVARGVRAMALLGHCPAQPCTMLHIATKIEDCAEPGSIPFVVDRGDGIADYGYAAARWVLDLYEWVVRGAGHTVPSVQRHRILGLLLGYSVEAIRQHEEHISGRHFHAPSESVVSHERVSNSQPACSPSRAETYPPC
jgi:hypothetical protein